MDIYELKVKIYLLKDIKIDENRRLFSLFYR